MKIILTGGMGFIGSCLLWKLNQEGLEDIVVVDELGDKLKEKNLTGKKFKDCLSKEQFIKSLDKFRDVDLILHIGACSSTILTDEQYYIKNNFEYTKTLAEFCLKNNIKFLYASSAATYGDGSLGFSDEDKDTPRFKPLNYYGWSKQNFDLWVLKNQLQYKFVGFKFFNVFGPNEYHKGEMRSLICKRFDDVVREKKIKLFKSYKNEYPDGGQKRDFIYVKDAIKMVFYFIEHPDKAGIYNVGTGEAGSWNDLAKALFSALNIPLNIEYIEMPGLLRDKYQYFTQADISKLRNAGYSYSITRLEDAIIDYSNYLKERSYL
ncbi:MAG: ADP-glyceromanno-heptose 6-epimerase [Candidatus Saganbacteria bacterium]|nr:ADP-glyceromanno-heptose 6-epimerase [Candidatus Saganbacteria bacterium]